MGYALRDDRAVADTRQAARIKLPPMYTLVRVRPEGQKRYCWTGFIYDISNSGMRFELDELLEPGTPIEVRVMLPGAEPTTFQASGRVVRAHDDADEPGPVRMGMRFDGFRGHTDRDCLNHYVDQHRLKIAA